MTRAKPEQIAFKLSQKLDGRIEQYAEMNGYNKSEAVRRLVEESVSVRLDSGVEMNKSLKERIDELEERVDELDGEGREEMAAQLGYHEERLRRIERELFSGGDEL